MKLALGYGVTALMVLSALPAFAAQSPWSESEGGRVRLSALAESEPGKVTAILEIEPASGWKTYWRDPGDAGMPPQIDLSAAKNLRLLTIAYPVPEIGKDEAGRFVGYHRPLGIVLELEKPDPAHGATLSANVLVGLCKEICLPFQASFELPLDEVQPKADEFMNIQMARATLPEAPSADFAVTQSGLTADRTSFEAMIVMPGKEMPDIAVAPSEGLLLGKQAEIVTKGGTAQIRYTVTRLPKSLEAATITLLVKSADRAMETTLAVK